MYIITHVYVYHDVHNMIYVYIRVNHTCEWVMTRDIHGVYVYDVHNTRIDIHGVYEYILCT